jgi:hypothetical protein
MKAATTRQCASSLASTRTIPRTKRTEPPSQTARWLATLVNPTMTMMTPITTTSTTEARSTTRSARGMRPLVPARPSTGVGRDSHRDGRWSAVVRRISASHRPPASGFPYLHPSRNPSKEWPRYIRTAETAIVLLGAAARRAAPFQCDCAIERGFFGSWERYRGTIALTVWCI